VAEKKWSWGATRPLQKICVTFVINQVVSASHFFAIPPAKQVRAGELAAAPRATDSSIQFSGNGRDSYA